jgi:hypothetical protein
MTTTLVSSYSMYENDFKESTLKEKNADRKNSTKVINGLTSAAVLAAAATTLINPVWDQIADVTFSAANDGHTLSMPASSFGQQVYQDFGQSIPDKIYSFLEYEKNWDGYDGVVPSVKTVNEAVFFFNRLPLGVLEPRPGFSGDGEISLFWEFDRVFVDIGFLGDGVYTIYAKDQEGIEYFKDEMGINESLPVAIKNLISVQ